MGYDFDAIIKPADEQSHYNLSYSEFVVPLVKAVQEQQAVIEDQKKDLEQKQSAIDDLTRRLEALEKLILGGEWSF